MTEASAIPDILLVGPRVSHLVPFFSQRGYHVDAHAEGADALVALQTRARDVVVLELGLGEMSALDFLAAARGSRPETQFLLLDEASRAGQIVKALTAGLHSYVPTPPNEEKLFAEVSRLLASSSRFRPNPEALATLQRDLQRAQGAVVESSMRADMLSQELDTAKLETEALKDEIDALRAEVDEKERELERHEAVNAAMPSEDEYTTLRARAEKADELTKRVDELEAVVEKRNAEITDLKRRLSETASRNAEIATSLAVREEQAARVEDLEKEATRAKDLDEQLKVLEEKAKAVDAATARAVEAERAAAAEKERAATMERAAAAAKLASEKAEARAKAAEERAESEAERVRKELEADIKKAHAERERADERAIDRELETDDLRAQIDEGLARIAELEGALKAEKRRFVEAQEQRGNDDAYRKMETMVEELTRLRRERDLYVQRFGPMKGES